MDEEICSFVRVKLFANAAMATEENLLREAHHWIEEEGGVMPPGNAAEAHLWSPASLSSSDEDDQVSADAVVSPFSKATVSTADHLSVQPPLSNTNSTVKHALLCSFSPPQSNKHAAKYLRTCTHWQLQWVEASATMLSGARSRCTIISPHS